jgi:hypothetical protein
VTRAGNETGQTIVVNVLFMVVMIGFLALVIDGGNLFLQRRDAQGTADAAALAGVLDVTRSRTTAESIAREYATTRNGSGVVVRQIEATGASPSSCGAGLLPSFSVCVIVERTQTTFLAQVLGTDQTTAAARAVASASQVQSIGGWLPIGLRSDNWTSGTQLSIAPNEGSALGGAINTPAGANCSFSGGSVIGQVIRSARFGGMDACPVEISQTIQTQTGVQNSQWTNQGFDQRLQGNTERFEDVFQFDPASGKYIVIRPDSPRVGIVPIASSAVEWPLSGNANIEVVAYALVYIGKRDNPNFLAPYTGQGNSGNNPLRVWLTPVESVLPESWEATVGDYDPNNPSITVYRLAQ